MKNQLSRLSWDDIDRLDREKTYFVLPISSLEQHGRHLPVGTDDMILQRVLQNICVDDNISKDIYFLPTIHYGNSHEHYGFPGTISLRIKTIAAIIEDVLAGMKQHAFQNVIVLNSHGGNSDLLCAFAQEWAFAYSINVYTINMWASSFFDDAKSMIQTPLEYDIHAGEIETSILMHTDSDCVKGDMISSETDVFAALDPCDYAWTSAHLSPENGVIGGASRASAQTGDKVLRYICSKIVRDLNRIAQKEQQLK